MNENNEVSIVQRIETFSNNEFTKKFCIISIVSSIIYFLSNLFINIDLLKNKSTMAITIVLFTLMLIEMTIAIATYINVLSINKIETKEYNTKILLIKKLCSYRLGFLITFFIIKIVNDRFTKNYIECLLNLDIAQNLMKILEPIIFVVSLIFLVISIVVSAVETKEADINRMKAIKSEGFFGDAYEKKVEVESKNMTYIFIGMFAVLFNVYIVSNLFVFSQIILLVSYKNHLQKMVYMIGLDRLDDSTYKTSFIKGLNILIIIYNVIYLVFAILDFRNIGIDYFVIIVSSIILCIRNIYWYKIIDSFDKSLK